MPLGRDGILTSFQMQIGDDSWPIMSVPLGAASKQSLFSFISYDSTLPMSRSEENGASAIDTTGLPLESPQDYQTLKGLGLDRFVQPSTGGRAVAAFARVACREQGYNHAPLVMNCFSLAQVLQSLSHHKDNETAHWMIPKELTELCDLHLRDGVWIMGDTVPAHDAKPPQCEHVVSVGPEGDNPTLWLTPTTPLGFGLVTSATFGLDHDVVAVEKGEKNGARLAYLKTKYNGATENGITQNSGLPWPHIRGLPLNFLSRHGVAPVPESATMTGGRVKSSPISSACTGDERNLQQCFRFQLERHYAAGTIKPQKTSCKNKLLVACIPGDGNQSDDAGHAKLLKNSTWVVGDRIDPRVGKPVADRLPMWWALRDNMAAVTKPAIFSGTTPKQCQVPDFISPHWPNYSSARTNCTWATKL